MTYYDIFNGDADGICALIQLRLAQPVDSTLITGVKRDISLVKQISAQAGDEVTILDISLKKNRDAVDATLAAGAKVLYADHHDAGELLEHENFTSQINTAPDVCTSLLINGYLKAQYPLWAVVGAFGDNLNDSAMLVASSLDINDEQIAQLKELGILMNYNAYGLTEADLHYTPQALFELAKQFESPLDFIEQKSEVVSTLRDGYAQDMNNANSSECILETNTAAVFVLPEASWARRINGVWGNDLANQFPSRAHAVLVEKPDGNYVVSVRAPLNNKQGAGEFCSQFETGGGRAAAAGVNDLPKAQIEEFAQRFNAFYQT